MAGMSEPSTPKPNAPSDDDAYIRKARKAGGSTMIIAVLVVIILVLAVVAGAYAAGWIGKKTTSNTGPPATNNTTKKVLWKPECGGSLTSGGSTFVYPLMAVWTSDYAGLACNSTGANGATTTQINYQSVGSGSGITGLTDGIYIYGASDAPLTYAQTQALKSGVVTMPDSSGAVTVIYNLAVKNGAGAAVPLNLSGPVIAAIYLGKITTWNDPAITAINAGITIPATAITVEHRSDGSGTSYAFSTFLSDENSTWKTTVGASTTPAWPTGIGDKGSEGVAGAVASTTGAIGYDELNYAQEAGTALEIAKVQNPAGNWISPTVTDTGYAVANASNLPSPTGNWSGYSIENGGGAGTYPIVTLTYLMIYTDIGKAPVYSNSYTMSQATALVDFLWWITHTGQNSSVGLFYVPLPAVMVAEDVAAIADIEFNGATLVSHAPST